MNNGQVGSPNITYAIEWYMVILLGVVDRPIPTELHLQKELFILSKTIEKVRNNIGYIKHHEGPYSVDLHDISKEPITFTRAYKKDCERGYILNNEGRAWFEKIVAKYSDDPEFIEELALCKMVREIYDRLSRDEMLLLIYSTYPEYTEASTVSERILDSRNKERLAKGLLNKGIITEERYKEIIR